MVSRYAFKLTYCKKAGHLWVGEWENTEVKGRDQSYVTVRFLVHARCFYRI